MHRIDSIGATIAGLFKGRTPAPATKVTPDWLNDVQENLVNVILAARLDLEKGDYGQLLEALRILGPPPGTVSFWGGWGNVPPGYLHCDGSPILKAEWPALYAAIADTWGDAPSDSQFMLPDFRGRVLRGWDGSPAAGRDPGRLYGTYQDDAVGPLVLQMPWATSPSSGNDLTANGGIMTDAVTANTITWAPVATNTEDETRMKNAAGMFLIKAY